MNTERGVIFKERSLGGLPTLSDCVSRFTLECLSPPVSVPAVKYNFGATLRVFATCTQSVYRYTYNRRIEVLD